MAELKERHGRRRTQYRGRDKVLMQALSAAMAYNIKQVVRARRRQSQPIALAWRPCPGTPARSHVPSVWSCPSSSLSRRHTATVGKERLAPLPRHDGGPDKVAARALTLATGPRMIVQ